MTFLVERLADLRKHLDHLREIRPQVIDIAGEIAGRRGIRFQDYREAVVALNQVPEIPRTVIEELALLPGFRNVLIHEYVALDYHRVVDALDRLEPVEQFARIVAGMERGEAGRDDG